MLEDPRVNFASSTVGQGGGVDHLGIQSKDKAELGELKDRGHAADRTLLDEGRDRMLLCAQREALGHQSAGDRVGVLPELGLMVLPI